MDIKDSDHKKELSNPDLSKSTKNPYQHDRDMDECKAQIEQYKSEVGKLEKEAAKYKKFFEKLEARYKEKIKDKKDLMKDRKQNLASMDEFLGTAFAAHKTGPELLAKCYVLCDNESLQEKDQKSHKVIDFDALAL